MSTYLYLLPGRGYFAGNKCFTREGKPISLSMNAEVGNTDAPHTPITYIRPRPYKISWLTEKQINLRHPNMQVLSGEDAIKKLLSRGRTLQEIKAHKKHYGYAIILDEDLAAYEAKNIPRVISVEKEQKIESEPQKTVSRTKKKTTTKANDEG